MSNDDAQAAGEAMSQIFARLRRNEEAYLRALRRRRDYPPQSASWQEETYNTFLLRNAAELTDLLTQLLDSPERGLRLAETIMEYRHRGRGTQG